MAKGKVRKPRIEESWLAQLEDAFASYSFQSLRAFLHTEKQAGKLVYPKGSDIFRAFDLCPFGQVKCVILGQDPYHGPGQAHGLCFSVPKPVDIPPSLQNIYKELTRDLGMAPPPHGDLSSWASQGVFLLNSVLTVEAHQAASHKGQGWESFTDTAIARLSAQRKHLVFMLWGNYARAKKSIIDHTKHQVLEAPHPSPLSAHRGFLGCGHFSKCNSYLAAHGIAPINWELSD
ncbi:MAG: uracil-DNA glycosylase [Bacteroidetes bacterium]|jgi:uracil-DNA glycosylase|nr:uracil-DNA glycosylase [Bacteroidota bacterium]